MVVGKRGGGRLRLVVARCGSSRSRRGGMLLLAAVMMAGTAPGAANASEARSGWAGFTASRTALLEELAPAFVDCFRRRDSAVDPGSPIFHGCIDWHSAVHAAYSHHVLHRRTGDVSYLDLVQEQVAPAGVSLVPAEQVYMQAKAPEIPLTEKPYGFGWFLIMARERELDAALTDFRPMADEAAAQVMDWFADRAAEGDAEGFILNAAHSNYSWSLINLDVWAKHTRDPKIVKAARAASRPLLDPVFDRICPVDRDTAEDAAGFQPPCLMRLAAVAHVWGASKRGWIERRVPRDLHIDPVTDPVGCHGGGLNFTRAFALYQLYKVTGRAGLRDNYAALIRYHVSRPDLYMGPGYLDSPGYLCYSHWVAQMGVRAISLSYER